MSVYDDLTAVLDRIDDDGPDLARLATAARRRGTRLRRRRRTAAGVAAAACLSLVAPLLIHLGGGGHDAAVSAPSTAPIAVVDPDLSGPRVPVSGPGAVEALVWATSQQRAGTASEPEGQYFRTTSGDYYAQVHWDDADGRGAGILGINVEHDTWFGACGAGHEDKLDCHVRRLPGGGLLVTQREVKTTSGGVLRSNVADLLRSDGIRVVVRSSNGFDGPGRTGRVTRRFPALSTADLAAIVREPIWGDRIPGAFVAAGRRLSSYDDETVACVDPC